MVMISGLRLVNALINGTITSGDLETALTTGGQLGQFEQITTVRSQCRLIARSANAMSRIVGSAAARGSVFANPDMVREMAISVLAMNAIAGSTAAMTAVASNDNVMAAFARSRIAMDAIYAVPAALTAIMPTSWAIYAPHTPLLTLSGSEVSGWINAQGTAARDLAQTTPGQRPVMVSGASRINGYVVPGFDGSDDVLTTSGSLNRTEYTVYAVLRRGNTASGGFLGNGVNFDGFGFNSSDQVTWAEASAGGARSYAAGTSWALVRLRRSGTSALFYALNADAEVSASTTPSHIPNFEGSLQVGRAFIPALGGQGTFNGQIAEIIITTQGANVDAETSRITNLLTRKYGLA